MVDLKQFEKVYEWDAFRITFARVFNDCPVVYAISIGASQTAISPLSTGGALAMAAYANIYKPSDSERSKVFVQMFIYAIAAGVVFALLGLVGFYGWFI